jgi:S1-C subfamily serine protease
MLTQDAYGKRLLLRTIVPLRGVVRHGHSGGPVVDVEGRVVAMIAAAAREGDGGFGVPTEEIERGLDGDLRPVPPGPCA